MVNSCERVCETRTALKSEEGRKWNGKWNGAILGRQAGRSL